MSSFTTKLKNISPIGHEKLVLYVKQDGLYDTLDLVISTEYTDKNLGKYWYSAVEGNLVDLLYYAFTVFMDETSDCEIVRFPEEDLIFTQNDIFLMNAEKVIL